MDGCFTSLSAVKDTFHLAMILGKMALGGGGCKSKAGEEIGTPLSQKPHHRPVASSICIKILFLVQIITEREAKKDGMRPHPKVQPL